MSTHTDLLTAAERAAAAAIAEDAGWQTRDRELRNAKNALEAAALAEDVGPGEITAALGEIQAELEAAGVLAKSLELEPAEFLKRTLAAVVHWRREADAAKDVVIAYQGLRELLRSLEKDFIAGDTETSLRIAARIRVGLDDAAQTIKNMTEEG